MRKVFLSVLVLALVAGSGCAAEPSIPPATQTSAPSSTINAPSTVRPTARPSPVPSPSSFPTPPPSPLRTPISTESHRPEPFDLEIHVIPTTQQAGSIRSLGTEIAWVDYPVDLYRYVPGERRPELVYSAPRGWYIPNFVGSSAGYAIITQESSKGFDPPVHWRLWYVAQAGAEPTLIDEVDSDQMLDIPDVAMDDRRIAWISHHGAGDDVISELRLADLGHLDQPRTLLSVPYWDAVIADPALNGDELRNRFSVSNWDADTASPRVEMLDLAHPEAPPESYGEDQRAFMPAVNDEVLVWKGGGTPEFAADNWGSLYVYWRADGTVERVPGLNWPGQPGDDRVMYPSLGNRFVAWLDGSAQLLVYDLVQRTVHRILENDQDGGIQEASVAGNLLAFPGSRR